MAFAARTELQCQPDRERVIGMLPRVRLGMCSSLGGVSDDEAMGSSGVGVKGRRENIGWREGFV